MISEGYHWARHDDGSKFIVLVENGLYFAPGVEYPLNHNFKPEQIICPVKPVEH